MNEIKNGPALEAKSLDERRTHERFDASLQLEGTPENGGVVARMVTSNLSMGGLYCVSTVSFPEMTRLAVRLMLHLQPCNDTDALDLEAVVVRQKELASANGKARYELALFFTGLDTRTRERLAAYLRV